jgi:hypothetical protein
VGDKVGHDLIHQAAKDSEPHEHRVRLVLKTLHNTIRISNFEGKGRISNLESIRCLEERKTDEEVTGADQKELAVLYRRGV